MIESLTYLSQILHSHDLPKNILRFQLLLALRVYKGKNPNNMSFPKKADKPTAEFKNSDSFKELLCLVRHCSKNSIDDLMLKLEAAQSEDDFFKKLETLLKENLNGDSILECVRSLSKNPHNPCNPYDGSKV